MASEDDFRLSSYRERMLEHLFIGELLRTLWLAGRRAVEVLRSEVDGAGYDLVLECDSVVRQVQLKASAVGGKRSFVDVQFRLGAKPGGCVIWILFDPKTFKPGPFLWFGSAPGKPLPDIALLKPARHAKANAHGTKGERPGLRRVPKGRFERTESIDEIWVRLFGARTSGGSVS